MTSPIMVDRVRTVPLVIENDNCYVPVIDDNSGFPFDRDFDQSTRDPDDENDTFRTQLDDLAKRHPEFAEHLGGFPFRSRGSTGGGLPPTSTTSRSTDDPEFRRFTERPFGGSSNNSGGGPSRFERFGFPFRRESFEGEPQPHHHNRHQQQQQEKRPFYKSDDNQRAPQEEYQQPQYYNSQPQEYYNQEQPQQTNVTTDEFLSEKPTSEVPATNRNIQQSNTVDLGQKQEPLVNDRNQRSMSAPPTENNNNNRSLGGGQRFVSSIKIPVTNNNNNNNNQSGMGDMGTQQSQQHHNIHEKSKPPMERVIPIHVEGRDVPVMPKNPNFTPSPQPQQQQQQPQPERIFGHRPSHFAQFMGRESPRPFGGGNTEWQHPNSDWTHHQGPTPDDLLRQQQQKFQQPQQHEQHQKTSSAPQQQQQAPKPQQEQQPPQSQQHHQTNKSIDMIQAIQKDVSALMSQVEQFAGQPRDKQYLYLDEMLTRNLIKLDNIDTQGQENIRLARKEAIKCIEGCISILEAKAAANVVGATPSGESSEQQNEQQMDVVSNDEKMDVVENPSASENESNTKDVIPHPIVAKSPSMFKLEQNKNKAVAAEAVVTNEQQQDKEEKMDVAGDGGNSGADEAAMVIDEKAKQEQTKIENKESQIEKKSEGTDQMVKEDGGAEAKNEVIVSSSNSDGNEEKVMMVDGKNVDSTEKKSDENKEKKEKKKGKKKVVVEKK